MLALTAVFAPGLFRLQLRTDGHALVPREDPAVQLDAEIRRQFDLRDPIVVYITSNGPNGIYTPKTLATVRALNDALATIEGIGPDHLMSLATERRDRVYPGTLRFRPFLDPLPDSQAALDRLRSDVAAMPILEGTLVTKDGRSTTILVGVPPNSPNGDRTALYRKIRDTARTFESDTVRIQIVGAPVAEALLGTHLLEDLGLMIPLAVTLIALVVWWGCRRVWGVALALIEVGACLLWTFGCMGWAGVPVYLTIAVLPVILTTIGLADEIHIFWHYQAELRKEHAGPHPQAVVATMDRMVRPVMLTSFTTSIGFLSFLASPIEPVRAFGLFAAMGILFCMVWSLTVIPALLTLIDPRRMQLPARSDLAGGIVRGLVRFTDSPRLTLAAILLFGLLGLLGAFRLRVQDSWIDGFARESPFRQAIDEVNEGLHGTHLLLVRLTFDGVNETAPLLDPAVLNTIGDFERFAREQHGVGGVLGTHTHLTAMNFLLSGRHPDSASLPPDSSGVERLLFYFDKVRGIQRRRQVVDDPYRATVVTLFLKRANFRDTAQLMGALREFSDRRLSPLGARLDFAGDVAVSQAMIPAVVGTQRNSLLLALVLAAATIGLLLRSAREALLAILPASTAALWVLGALGWLGIPLGVATSMFFAITLGIGVDYAIHFLDAVRRCRTVDPPGAVTAALHQVGPAIVVDALALALGFGLLAASQVPANARLGLIVGLALVSGAALTLGGLGAALRTQSPHK